MYRGRRAAFKGEPRTGRVEALGGHGEHVTEPRDIRPALERARASDKASCVNVLIDPNVYSSGTMNQTMYR